MQQTRGDLRGASQGPLYPWHIAIAHNPNAPRWVHLWQPRHQIDGIEGPIFDDYDAAQAWVEEQKR